MGERAVQDQKKPASEQDENREREEIQQVKKERKPKTDQSWKASVYVTQEGHVDQEKWPNGKQKLRRSENERKDLSSPGPSSSLQGKLREEKEHEFSASRKEALHNEEKDMDEEINALLDRPSKFLNLVPDLNLDLIQPLQLRVSRVFNSKRPQIWKVELFKPPLLIDMPNFMSVSLIRSSILNTDIPKFKIIKAKPPPTEVPQAEAIELQLLMEQPSEVSREQSLLECLFRNKDDNDRISSIFEATEPTPKCIILRKDLKGDRSRGQKILEDLLKENLRYWGISHPRVEQEDIRGTDEGEGSNETFEKILEGISNPNRDLISIQWNNALKDWGKKLLEKLKEAESQGLKYILLSGDPLVLDFTIARSSSIDLFEFWVDPEKKETNAVRDLEILQQLAGVDFRRSREIIVGGIDSYWTELMRESRRVREDMRRMIANDPRLGKIQFRRYGNGKELSESPLHYLMRAVTYRWLLEEFEEVVIKIENEIKGKRVDFAIENGPIQPFVEVETGYPTSEELQELGERQIISPEFRLLHKLQRLELLPISDLWVILPTLFCQLHLHGLKTIQKELKRQEVHITFFQFRWSLVKPIVPLKLGESQALW